MGCESSANLYKLKAQYPPFFLFKGGRIRTAQRNEKGEVRRRRRRRSDMYCCGIRCMAKSLVPPLGPGRSATVALLYLLDGPAEVNCETRSARIPSQPRPYSWRLLQCSRASHCRVAPSAAPTARVRIISGIIQKNVKKSRHSPQATSASPAHAMWHVPSP